MKFQLLTVLLLLASSATYALQSEPLQDVDSTKRIDQVAPNSIVLTSNLTLTTSPLNKGQKIVYTYVQSKYLKNPNQDIFDACKVTYDQDKYAQLQVRGSLPPGTTFNIDSSKPVEVEGSTVTWHFDKDSVIKKVACTQFLVNYNTSDHRPGMGLPDFNTIKDPMTFKNLYAVFKGKFKVQSNCPSGACMVNPGGFNGGIPVGSKSISALK